MKYYYRILLLAIAAGITVSCADAPFADFKTEKPESLKKYEYLNEYGDLKTYINRTAHPNFKLGTGVSVSDFLKQDLVYALTVNNYDDVTAGNAMKYSSCVDAKGNMDFGTVKKFVKTAKEAGISIYGHTLCWHSQQQNAYLSGLIADKTVEVDPSETEEKVDAYVDYSVLESFPYWNGGADAPVHPEINNGVLTVKNDEVRDPFYILQYHAANGIATIKGGSYKLTLYIRGSSAGSLTAGIGGWGNIISTTLNFTDAWQEVSVELNNIPVDNSFVILQSGNFAGTYEIKWLKVTHTEAVDSSVSYESLVTNGNAEGDDVSCFFANEPTVSGTHAATIGASGTGADGVGRAFIVKSGNNPSQTYDTQFFVKSSIVLKKDDICKISFKYKADKAAGSESQTHTTPGGYIHHDAGVSVNFTTQWQTFEKEFTVTEQMVTHDGIKPFQTIAWNLAVFKEANTYYFDDIEFSIQRKGAGIPLTPEEKEEILTNELERWIKGMLESCDGYVKAWDVVNEPISETDSDGDRYYDLQSASQPDDNGVSGQNFYWQDYLGDDYARIPIKFARKYFAESGGNPDELKLFINDYNLESDREQNKKLRSLIHWIERWESDGETKVDGIGTQMHVSYYMNPATQASKENAIINMFNLLASTGKLIKITELDMGIVDAAGETILTENLTDEMQQNMSDFYQFIIEKYFEIIPVAQQYGITHWSPTDSPSENSFWRKGQPIGLWDLNYNRKPVYVGFLEGLKNGTAK